MDMKLEILLCHVWLVELVLTSDSNDKIFICYGHCNDFRDLPGSALLLMALERCNACVWHNINGATSLFNELTLDSYPGENISDFATEVLH